MQAFNEFLLIGCVGVVVSLLLYFFYWNRLIALLLGVIIRLVYWNQDPSSIWLEIGSIHFSILTGRILIKDLRYYSSNQAIKIVKGQLEWRYWIRRPASAHDIAPPPVMDDQKQTRAPACRVQISLQGFEWFLYNRTAAYDSIVSQMGVKLPSRPTSRNTDHRQSSQRSAVPVRLPTVLQKSWHWVRRQLPTLDPKDLLPLGIEVTKGAIICGNPSTPNLLVVEFKRTEGMFGIVQSRSKYDLYKQLLHLSFQQALARYVQNDDYRGPMTTTGEMLQTPIKKYSKLNPISMYLSYQAFAKLWRHLKLYAVTRRRFANQDLPSQPAPPSRGKHKSLDEEPPFGADFSTFEYAIERKILEAPVLELTYYTDVVGDVPAIPHPVDQEKGDIGNGDMGPEWGIDLVVRGGFLRYGPWADRQRSKSRFFPPTYQNVQETPHLKPGDKRVWTAMQIFIELRDDTTFYIPFREASKNWQWDEQSQLQRRPRRREPASVHVTVGDRSSINYIMPMVAGPEGYEPVLEVHLDTVAITSSLNDIPSRIRGELPSPLQWDGRRTWKFGLSFRQPVLYILRDHINMLTDLGKDWASGPPSDYYRFVPTVYVVELELHHFELNLYVNDHNIIDKPLIRDENALLTARGLRLKNVTEIPSDLFRPESTTIPFFLEIPDIALSLSLPRWNTYALHAPIEGSSLAKVGVLRLDGFYRYFSEVREDHVEQLKLTLTVRDIAYKGLGWSIRYFMILQNNYFGSFTKFSTLFEYLERRKKGLAVGDPVLQQYRKGQSNMLEVDLDVDLQNGLMVIPAGLPGYERSNPLGSDSHSTGIGACLLLDIPELQVHLRLHDFFMELSLNIGTITGSIEADFGEEMAYTRPKRRSKETIVIDGIDITADRLFGPLPRTTTYVCIWEIRIGAVKTVISARDAAILSAAGNAFRLNFVDASNAPAAEHIVPEPPDVTFLKFSLAALDVAWRTDHATLLFSLPHGLKLDTNDSGGKYHRRLTSLRLPLVSTKVLLRSLTDHHRWLEVAGVESDAYLDIYSSPRQWQTKAQAQAAFIHEQDLPSGRAKRMMSHLKGVFLPQPALSSTGQYRSADRSGSTRPIRLGSPAERPGHWPKLPHLSESDSGEEVLEMHRDALVEMNPIPISVTGSSSEGDWSEMDSYDVEGKIPALKQYSHLCRQYATAHLDFPSRWEGSPFALVRCYKDLRITLTPLVIMATSSLEADLERNILSPELSLDRILATYLSGFATTAKSMQNRIFDLRLSSVHFHILHDVKPVEVSKPHTTRKDTAPLTILNYLAHLECHFNHGMLLDGKISQLILTPAESLVTRSIFDLDITTCSLNIVHGNPAVVLGGVGLELGHESPETIDQLSALKQKWEQHNSSIPAAIVFSILQASHNKPVIDPLSTIQPSYLNLRIDTVFRFLFHLRNCLWELGREDQEVVVSRDNLPSDVMQSLMPLLEARIRILDPDAFHETQLSSLHPLFPGLGHPTAPKQTSARQSLTSASLEVAKLAIMIRDQAGGAAAEFSLTDFVSTMGRRTFDFTMPRQRYQHIHLIISPRLMPFAQVVLRARRRYSTGLLTEPRTHHGRRGMLLSLPESLIFEFGISGIQVVSNSLLRPHHSVPQLFLLRTEQDILASITFTACKINSLLRYEFKSVSHVRLVALQWRADFLPGIESTLQRAPAKPLSPKPSLSTKHSPTLQMNVQVDSFGVSLQVMHGTWLSWRVNNIVAYLNSLGAVPQTFGLQLMSQTFSISSRTNTQDTWCFPSLSLCGDSDGSQIQVFAMVDFLEFKVKPVHWDTLLAVQQKFGQDFNDLVTLVQETRSAALPQKPWSYSGFLKMRGFRIGLEGLSSTFYLECFDISGSINTLSRRTWSLKLTDLALSLASKTAIKSRDAAFNRRQRSAFVIIDFEVKGGEGEDEEAANNVLQIAVTKIHAVMQPSSIGEVGDFVDHLQAELWDRKEQRAIELAAFKDKAQSILKTFEVPVHDVQVEEKPSWLNAYVINMSIHNIGVAFPLTHDQNLEIPETGTGASPAVPAFLFSIKSIKFGTQRGESGEAKMQGLSFQFVSRFRQTTASDFAGYTHQTRNRLLYPEMTAQLRSSGLGSSRSIWMRANVSGFILDIDSTIPDFIFSLIDVYEQGKERVSRLSASILRNTPPEEPLKSAEKDKLYTALPTSNVFASLTFLSGKVRAYNMAASASSQGIPLSHIASQPLDEHMIEVGADIFNLPMVSVWTEYRATAASRKIANSSESDPSILIFKSTVHSSQNTLKPTTLLPFLSELVSHVESRMRQATRSSAKPAPDIPDASDLLPISPDSDSNAVSSMQISFSLRIDQSKLELTCQPDVNVIAGLHWDSGGFVIHVSPGARKVTLTGSIGGLNIGLKHGFLSEECAKLDARNLAFSVTFAKTGYGTGRPISSVSFVLDTEFLGAVRFSRLQDILCFKAVWLDRIPVFNPIAAEAKSPTKSLAQSSSHMPAVQEFTTVLLIRIRQISLEVDLGQSISVVTLNLNDAIARTKITEQLNEVSLTVSDVSVVARGNVAGHASVSNCVFQTIRRMQSSSVGGRNRMLELRMTSDALVAVLESDHQKLLHYRAEPLEVEIFDDWSKISSDIRIDGRTLQFSVTVESPEIVAAVTVGTIPKLLSYANKFKANLEAQRDGAARESQTFQLSRAPNPEYPLSAVAEAMLVSARSRFKEADAGLSHIVRQHMRLRLGILRLVVFPRTMGDLEIAQFIGRDVCAQLDRLIDSQTAPAKRDLHLSFSFMTISRFTQLGHLAPPTILSDGREWLTSLLKDAAEANIVGLPEEIVDTLSSKVLQYNFDSCFNRQQGTRNFEDIYISLNVALYSWLTLLRKNLTREMDQVRATAEWRSSTSPAIAPRRKAAEGLQPQPDTPKTATAARHPIKTASLAYPKESVIYRHLLVQSEATVVYHPNRRNIERLTMRQLGEATPDVMHPFFMKKAGFNLEDSLPQYVHEYATVPLEEIMEVLLKLYSKQLLAGNRGG
ncbi:hypothetical protein C8J57DRAFT_1431026 [Mycena rebaudengoi]|nr:hypothetical protein C8J57DRAFT_1431026 [Mycena rebaudengoi]